MKFINFLEKTKREVFILRVWKTQNNDAPLRGQLQHVRSGQTFLILEPEQLLSFIQEQVEVAEPQSTPSGIR